MTLKIRALALAALPLALLATSADAHRRWLLPSATVLSGDTELVTVDAASSNQLFVFEHRPLPADNVTVTGPDGQPVATKIIGSGDYRSAFDVPLTQQGTYRIALVNDGLMGTYMLDGERKRWRGTRAEMANAVPAGGTEARFIQTNGRIETFVTLGAPNETALQPTGQGLELVPVTHPNDIVVGEPARFQFLSDGQPAANLKVEFVEGGTRYRDAAGSQELTTDAEGMVELTAERPGYYYIEAGMEGTPPADDAIAGSRSSYTGVLEFLPL